MIMRQVIMLLSSVIFSVHFNSVRSDLADIFSENQLASMKDCGVLQPIPLDDLMYRNEKKLFRWTLSRDSLASHHFLNSPILTARVLLQAGKAEDALNYLMSNRRAAMQWGGSAIHNPILEQLLGNISSAVIPPTQTSSRRVQATSEVKKILHVVTSVREKGGHQDVITSLIESLPTKQHSVYFTEGRLDDSSGGLGGAHVFDVPASITLEVKFCRDSLVSCANELRTLSLAQDLVLLHLSPSDFVPSVAFAARYSGPPVVLLDHADHLPWVGSAVLDARVVFRHSALGLAVKRGLEPERDFLIPLPTRQETSRISKAEARKKLGFNDSQVILLSAAPVSRFGHHMALLDLILPVLESHPDAVYTAPQAPPHWQHHCLSRCSPSQCRLDGHPWGNDSALLHAAADIHLDSFPLASLASSLQSLVGGAAGLSFCPWGDSVDWALCLDPADVGRVREGEAIPVRPMLTCRSPEKYREVLGFLVEAAGDRGRWRVFEGFLTSAMQGHVGSSWVEGLERMIKNITSLAPRDRS